MSKCTCAHVGVCVSASTHIDAFAHLMYRKKAGRIYNKLNNISFRTGGVVEWKEGIKKLSLFAPELKNFISIYYFCN